MIFDQNRAGIENLAFTVADNRGKIGNGVANSGFSVNDAEKLFFSHFVFRLPEPPEFAGNASARYRVDYSGFSRFVPIFPKKFCKNIFVVFVQIRGFPY